MAGGGSRGPWAASAVGPPGLPTRYVGTTRGAPPPARPPPPTARRARGAPGRAHLHPSVGGGRSAEARAPAYASVTLPSPSVSQWRPQSLATCSLSSRLQTAPPPAQPPRTTPYLHAGRLLAGATLSLRGWHPSSPSAPAPTPALATRLLGQTREPSGPGPAASGSSRTATPGGGGAFVQARGRRGPLPAPPGVSPAPTRYAPSASRSSPRPLGGGRHLRVRGPAIGGFFKTVLNGGARHWRRR